MNSRLTQASETLSRLRPLSTVERPSLKSGRTNMPLKVALREQAARYGGIWLRMYLKILRHEGTLKPL